MKKKRWTTTKAQMTKCRRSRRKRVLWDASSLPSSSFPSSFRACSTESHSSRTPTTRTECRSQPRSILRCEWTFKTTKEWRGERHRLNCTANSASIGAISTTWPSPLIFVGFSCFTVWGKVCHYVIFLSKQKIESLYDKSVCFIIALHLPYFRAPDKHSFSYLLYLIYMLNMHAIEL